MKVSTFQKNSHFTNIVHFENGELSPKNEKEYNEGFPFIFTKRNKLFFSLGVLIVHYMKPVILNYEESNTQTSYFMTKLIFFTLFVHQRTSHKHFKFKFVLKRVVLKKRLVLILTLFFSAINHH